MPATSRSPAPVGARADPELARSGATIDLNADLGEADALTEVDRGLLQTVTSANIACGGHAGSPSVMRAACELALERGVTIGAHPSYPDRAGFGRRPIAIDEGALLDALVEQIERLDGIARSCGSSVRYVKLHGALYNEVYRNERLARVVVDAVVVAGRLPLLCQERSSLRSVASKMGLTSYAEGFADRRYRHDGSLAPRAISGAVLSDPELVMDQALRIATGAPLESIDGPLLGCTADSICVHSDTAGAAELAAALRRRLRSASVEVASFLG
jgi:UPF0271 protein